MDKAQLSTLLNELDRTDLKSVLEEIGFYDNIIDSKDIENIKIPHVIKDKTIMSPGIWNNYYYSKDAIEDAFQRTDWDDKEIRSLFFDHEDRRSKEWIGEVINLRMDGDTLKGDLVIVDKPAAQKLAYGAKFGISPKVHGTEDNGSMVSFVFDNNSVVINPAVKTAYINNQQIIQEDIMMDTTIENKSEIKKPYGDVPYADPGYRGDEKRYPLDTKEHVKAAWSYINMPKNQEFYTKDQLDSIKSKIISAAKKYDIKISEDEKKMAEEEIIASETAPVAPSEPAVEQPVEEVKPAEEASAEPIEEPANEDEPKADEPVVEEPKVESEEVREETMQAKDVYNLIMQELKNISAKVTELQKESLANKQAKVEMAEKKTETTDVVSEMQHKINDLNEQIGVLTQKLNEPAGKQTVKTETMSQNDIADLVKANPDAALLSMLQRS